MNQLAAAFAACLDDHRDLAAHARLVSHPYWRHLAWRALRQAPRRPAVDADDLAQEARLAALVCVRGYRWICRGCDRRYANRRAFERHCRAHRPRLQPVPLSTPLEYLRYNVGRALQRQVAAAYKREPEVVPALDPPSLSVRSHESLVVRACDAKGSFREELREAAARIMGGQEA